MAEWAAEPEDQSHSETYTVQTAMSVNLHRCAMASIHQQVHTHTQTQEKTPPLCNTQTPEAGSWSGVGLERECLPTIQAQVLSLLPSIQKQVVFQVNLNIFPRKYINKTTTEKDL